MKKIIAMLLPILLVAVVLTACTGEQEHVHTFADEWHYDESNHWHTATCEHVDEVSEKAAHVDADGNDICDTCGYIADHTHTFESTLTQGEDTHYYKASCGHNVKREEALHTDGDNDGSCDVCAYNGGHEHTFEEGWTGVEAGHWHAPTCDHSVDGLDLQAHADENNDGDCDVCGYNGGHEHTYAEAYTTTADEHWREVTCGHSIAVADKNAHLDENGDDTCDVCGYVPEHFHTFAEAWSSDADAHWHGATCEHADVKKDEAAHDGVDADGICDTCGYVVFKMYTVSFNVPYYVTVAMADGRTGDSFRIRESTDAVFTITVPTTAELISLSGATLVGDPAEAQDALVYTVKLESVKADAAVTLVCNKISAVDVIVEEGKGSVTITGTFKYAYDDITFTAPTAGRYVIFSPDCPELPFGSGEKDEEGNDVYRQILTVDVTKPGDVTVQARYFPWSVPESGKMEYTYVVTRYEDTMTLRELVGSGYTLPTNVDVTIHFTAPKKGQYQISSSMLGLAWNDYLCDSIVLVAEEDNQSMSFTVRYENSTAVSYDFDWSIVLLEAEEVAVGENTVTAPYGQYSAISFVADRAGAYMVRVEDPFMRLYSWSSELQSMSGEGISYITASLNAGDEVELFLSVDIFDYEGTDDITGIVTVLYLGHVVEESNGAYISFVSFPNTYVSGYEASDFILTVSAGAEISTDGSNWSTSVQVSVADYGVLTYYVRTTGGTETVAVSVTRIAYEFTLEVGTHSHSMIPGKEYTVYLSGTVSDEWYVDYILTWSQENVEVFFNGYPVASGEIIENYSEYYALSIVYTGSETTGIEFTLVDPLAP